MKTRIRTPLLLTIASAVACGLAAHAQQTLSPERPRRLTAVHPVPYEPMPAEDFAMVLERTRSYLDVTTPPGLIDRETGASSRSNDERAGPAAANQSCSGLQFGPDAPTIQRVKLHRKN